VLVVDHAGQPELVSSLRDGAAYEVAYRDNTVAVLARR
jgi:hypothetical protein